MVALTDTLYCFDTPTNTKRDKTLYVTYHVATRAEFASAARGEQRLAHIGVAADGTVRRWYNPDVVLVGSVGSSERSVDVLLEGPKYLSSDEWLERRRDQLAEASNVIAGLCMRYYMYPRPWIVLPSFEINARQKAPKRFPYADFLEMCESAHRELRKKPSSVRGKQAKPQGLLVSDVSSA